MNRKRTIRISLSAIGGFVAVLISHSLAAAQCAMCKSAITGSPDAGRLAANFNFAVLVLLIPPVLIFCGIFFAVFKYRETDGDEPAGDDHRPNFLRRRIGKLHFKSSDWNLSRTATNPNKKQDLM